jgi:putative GTP pyrophosphokinase
MTKGQIDRLGDKIRTEYGQISEETISELQTYRTSHKNSLSQVFNVLCKVNKTKGKNIVTYRIKRFESIIGKLYRYPKMKLSRMWDIGGCRCIVQSDEDVYKLKSLIENSTELEIRKEYDYIKTPQEEGYKSLHLFVSIKNDTTVIELQIRNRIDHNWATLVEITDLLFDAKLKEYGENKDLLRFHLLLSKRTELTIEEKIEIAKTIKKYKYFERLSDVFTRNYLQVRKQWLDIETQHKHNYFLIETKKDEIPKINAFKTFEDAEIEYFNIYKNSHNANVVLTHLPFPSYEQISIAYSNYILTFHSFLDDCYDIFESLIEKTLIGKHYFDYIKYFTQYNIISYNHIKNVVKEITEINSIALKNKKGRILNKKKNKEKEWINDINNHLKKRKEKQMALHYAYRKHMPNSFLGRQFIIRTSKFISKRFENKLKKLTTFN